MERGDGSQASHIRIHLLIMNARNKETMATIYVSFSRARGFIDKYLHTNSLHRMLQHQGTNLRMNLTHQVFVICLHFKCTRVSGNCYNKRTLVPRSLSTYKVLGYLLGYLTPSYYCEYQTCSRILVPALYIQRSHSSEIIFCNVHLQAQPTGTRSNKDCAPRQ